MEWPEIYRARHALTVYATLVAGVLLVLVLGLRFGGVAVRLDAAEPHAVPLGALLAIAGFMTMIFATPLAASLSHENATLELSWTRPIDRAQLAVRYAAVDLVALAAAQAVALVAVLIVPASVGVGIAAEPADAAGFVLALGAAAMWYALIVLLTCRLQPSRTGLVFGFIWPVALFALALGEGLRSGVVRDVCRLIDVVNPLAYVQSTTVAGASGAVSRSLWNLPVEERALVVWAFAVAFVAAAALLWKHREV